MLRYTVRQLELARRYYLLLPKLNSFQMGVVEERLKRVGYAVRGKTILRAHSSNGSMSVDHSGLCWGPGDPADVVLPAIPTLLAAPRENMPAAKVLGLYYRVARVGRKTLVRLSTRLESSASWDRLRAAGECGLAPDEHLVATRLLESWEGTCRLTTDFAVANSVPTRAGGRALFASEISGGEAASTLRASGERRERNSYLPRSGIIEMRGRGKLHLHADVVDELGEWCSYGPSG